MKREPWPAGGEDVREGRQPAGRRGEAHDVLRLLGGHRWDYDLLFQAQRFALVIGRQRDIQTGHGQGELTS